MKDYSVLLPCGESTMIVIHDAFDKGYQQGYKDARNELGQNAIDLAHEESDRAYQQGLEDAWEAAGKIAKDDGLPIHEVGQIFGTVSFCRIIKENTASEAIAKIKEYEEQQKQDTEIKVGDEVYSEMYDLRFIVTRLYDGRYEGVCTDGAAYCPLPDDVKKTGRHTETILKVLGEFYEKD